MEDFWYAQPTNFFSRLNRHDKQTLLNVGIRRRFAKDEMVFHAGSPSDDVYILLDGRVKVFELSKEGKEVILWFCFPGELFGLSEILRRGAREVNAQACSHVDVLSIKCNDFEKYIQQHPHLALQVIELLSYRLRELSDVLLNLASDDVTSRVIKLITRLSARYGKPLGDGVHLDIALTHQEMADMIGTSRQTVTTVLGMLRKKGILRMEQRTIYIQDTQWIENAVGKSSLPVSSSATINAMRNTA